MIRTLQTFSIKLDINGFDIIKTSGGYQADYCGVETGDIWTPIVSADTYEQVADYIKSISEGK
jgi:hypothetical protein